ncbi:alpha/beta hydrolase family protein [Paenibacillus agricola]|uniref:Acetylxylan esterase n=1 Tax=Paenibacillus agricola TaxID=2716264 RepID=A0ABX0JG81_9BACL|nr:acetylxylan esterase [Paenibacillus agricola]NHN34791.1 acetylxylan esterase [Paenibacillus agricola]
MSNHFYKSPLLPDPLLGCEGEKILTAEQWQQIRRPEILELFHEHVYGRAPLQRPQYLRFITVDKGEGWMGGKAVRKKIDIGYEGPGGNGVIHLYLFVPAQAIRPVPTFLLICNREAENMDPDREVQSPFWPAEHIVSRGYAAAVFHVEDLDPDKHDGFKNGVHGIFDPPEVPRPKDAWGTLAAWAWGASRVMDYLETDPDIDDKSVALVGHSRGGKTALWCGAQDERFAMVVSNDSGCGGAAITRCKKGETINNINERFPHWFCENYKSFNGRENELPIDQHMLLSLIAPRLLYVASASEDTWADPDSEFLACTHAERVYNLLGLKGLETLDMPAPECPLHQGSIGYHLRTGKHDLTLFDWNCFMDYADRHMKEARL